MKAAKAEVQASKWRMRSPPTSRSSRRVSGRWHPSLLTDDRPAVVDTGDSGFAGAGHAVRARRHLEQRLMWATASGYMRAAYVAGGHLAGGAGNCHRKHSAAWGTAAHIARPNSTCTRARTPLACERAGRRPQPLCSVHVGDDDEWAGASSKVLSATPALSAGSSARSSPRPGQAKRLRNGSTTRRTWVRGESGEREEGLSPSPHRFSTLRARRRPHGLRDHPRFTESRSPNSADLKRSRSRVRAWVRHPSDLYLSRGGEMSDARHDSRGTPHPHDRSGAGCSDERTRRQYCTYQLACSVMRA